MILRSYSPRTRRILAPWYVVGVKAERLITSQEDTSTFVPGGGKGRTIGHIAVIACQGGQYKPSHIIVGVDVSDYHPVVGEIPSKARKRRKNFQTRWNLKGEARIEIYPRSTPVVGGPAAGMTCAILRERITTSNSWGPLFELESTAKPR